MSNLYGPIDVSSRAATVQVSGYPDSGCIVIYNESPLYLQVTFVGAGQHSYPAFTGDIFQARAGFNGTIQIQANPYLTTSGQAPANVVFILTYGSTDALTTTLLKGGSTSYPISLNRLSSIGNSLNVGTSTSSTVNDGNPLGTQFIEVTPTGAPGSTWAADNTGNLTVNSDNAGTLTTLLQLIAGASPAVKLAAAAVLTEVLGPLQVDGDATLLHLLISGATLPANYPKFSSDSSGNLNIDAPNGTRRLQLNTAIPALIASTGMRITADRFDLTGGGGQYNMNVGSLSRISLFSGTGTGTFNHGLGAVPNFVIPICTAAGSTQTMGFSASTSNQVTITTGAGLAWTALAIRF